MSSKRYEEINVSGSNAIVRMVYDKSQRGSLLVQFHNTHKVYRYFPVSQEIVDLVVISKSFGAAIARLKKLTRVKTTHGFPSNIDTALLLDNIDNIDNDGEEEEEEDYEEEARKQKETIINARRRKTGLEEERKHSDTERLRGKGKGRETKDKVEGDKKRREYNKKQNKKGSHDSSSAAIGFSAPIDYSNEWLEAIESAGDCSVESKKYLCQCIDALDDMPEEEEILPPHRLPPIRRSSMSASSAREESRANANDNRKKPGGRQRGGDSDVDALRNRFGALNVDGEDDVEEAGRVASESRAISISQRSGAHHRRNRSIQRRYLRMYAVGGVAECMRKAADDFLRKGEYQLGAQEWGSAYEYLNAYFETDFMNEWVIVLLDVELQGPTAGVADAHNLLELQRVVENLELLRDHTEMKRLEALGTLKGRREHLLKILNPLLDDRDRARNRIGVELWENNPSPKYDYAAKRKVWEEELKAVEDAMVVLGNLHLESLRFDNDLTDI